MPDTTLGAPSTPDALALPESDHEAVEAAMRRHVQEEQTSLFPPARVVDIHLGALGEQLALRKAQCCLTRVRIERLVMVSRSQTRHARATAAASLILLAGCATTQVDSQWADPQFAGTSLRGAKVLVVCEAYDIGVKRSCEDQLSSEVVARGATPVADPDAAPGAARTQDQYLDAARAADAKAVLAVAVSFANARSGPGFSIGLGGFGGSGRVLGGVGVSVPIGGHQLQTGHAASGRLTDASDGRLLWTARATTAPSSDLNAQMAELAKAVVGAAEKAGLF